MKNFHWAFISIIFVSASQLLLRTFLGRDLGPSGLGTYMLVYTIYLFGIQFAGFGIGPSLTKYTAEFKDDTIKSKQYISTGLISSFIVGSIMALLLYVLSEFISIKIFNSPQMNSLLKLTALTYPFLAIYNAVLGTLNGYSKMKIYAFFNLSLYLSILLMSIFLVHFLNKDLIGAVLGFILPTIFFGLIALFLAIFRLKLNLRNFVPQKEIIKTLIYFGFYIVLGNSIAYLYVNLDSLMIGYYLSSEDVGVYSISLIFIQGLTLIPNSMQLVTNPIITRYYSKKQYSILASTMKNIAFKVFLISVFISLLIVITGKTIITNIFNPSFISAYYPLLILLIGYSIYSPLRSIGTFYSSIGKVKLPYKISILSAFLNLIFNIILIPKYGISGAAMATSIALIILTYINFVIIKNITKNWNLE